MEFVSNAEEVPLFKDFIRFFTVYFLAWLKITIKPVATIHKAFNTVSKYLYQAKTYMVKKLLWRRGLLSRPLIHTGSLMMAGILLISSNVVGADKTYSQEDVSKQLQPKYVPAYQSSMVQEESDTLIEAVPVKTIIPANRPREGVIQYTVADGDSLSSVAEKFNINTETITYANELSDDEALEVGAVLDILPASGYIYYVEEGNTIEGIASFASVPPQVLVETNWLTKPYTLYIDQQLIIPGDVPKPAQPDYVPDSFATFAPSVPAVSSGQFMWPTSGSMTRGYGWYYGYFHDAIDIADQSCGTAVYAADGGSVLAAGWRTGGWGNTVWIDHGNGYVSRYAHLSSVSVAEGAGVAKGQLIGGVGDTGLAYGCHLHFVVDYNGSTIDPLAVL